MLAIFLLGRQNCVRNIYQLVQIWCLSIIIIDALYFHATIISAYKFPHSFLPHISFLPTIILSVFNLRHLYSTTPIATQRKLPNGRFETKETQASFFSRLTFSWFNDLIDLGDLKHLEMADLWELREDDQAQSVIKEYDQLTYGCPLPWLSLQPALIPLLNYSHPKTLLRRLVRLVRKYLCLQAGFALVSALLSFSGPFFLNQILKFVQNPSSPTLAFSYVIGLFVCNTIRAICDGQTYFNGRRIGTRVRAVIIGKLYEKSLRRVNKTVESNEGGAASTGEIVNLMAVDASKILEVSCYLMYIWSTPLQACICISLLIYVLGWPALTGLAWMLMIVPIGGYLGRNVQRAQKQFMKSADARMRGVTEILQAIKIIKLLAWESHFTDQLSALRSKELSNLRRYISFAYISRIVWASTPIFVSCISFFTYTKIAGRSLDASTAFTALSLFNTLRHPLQTFPDIIVRIMEAIVSLQRCEKFLNEEELERFIGAPAEDRKKLEALFGAVTIPAEQDFGGISLRGQYSYHHRFESFQDDSDGFRESFRLSDVNLKFPTAKLSMVVGSTGAGKTSLLLSLLGEMRRISGDYDERIANGVAYSAQTAWLQNCTVRDNILFGEPYDELKYREVLHACALIKDLEIMEGGDLTEIGEKGVNVSGGQKQRIALARAAYGSSPVVLLDDVLSAVDAPTARHLFEECILRLMLEKQQRTVILITHAVGLCVSRADFVVVIKGGKIADFGHPSKLERSKSLQDVLEAEAKIDCKREEVRPVAVSGTIAGMEKLGTRITTEEGKMVGSVSYKVYWAYISAAGGASFLAVLLLAFCLTQSMSVSQDYWVKTWANAYRDNRGSTPIHHSSLPVGTINILQVSTQIYPILASTDNTLSSSSPVENSSVNVNFYILVYMLIGLGTIMSLLLRLTIQAFGSLRASRVFHSSVVEKLMRAPLRFFETTPVGRIMNRLGKDVRELVLFGVTFN